MGSLPKTTRPPHRRGRGAAVTCLAATALIAAPAVAVESADLVSDPPRVESVAVQLIEPPSPRAYLFVQYAPDARLGAQVTLNLGDEVTVLRDDGESGDEKAGDHVYTGTFTLDIAGLEADLRSAASARGDGQKVPVFSGREVAGYVDLSAFNVGLLSERVRQGIKISLNKYGVCSVQPIDWEKSLLIRNPQVVGDADRTYDRCAEAGKQGTAGKAWTFGYLVRQMAGGSTASNATVSLFLKNWMEQWKTEQTVNGWKVEDRSLIESLILQPWRTASMTPGPGSGSVMEYDPDKAPFRLLAIVNRTDKSDSIIYGRSGAPRAGNAGELRFVFGAMSKDCQPLKFTVIMEFEVDRKDCKGITEWAKSWIALSQLSFGASYNQALEALTEQIVKYDTTLSKPNKSRLAQIRTNDLSLETSGAGWDMREFHLSDSNQLVQSTVADTPDASLNKSTTLRDYINANCTVLKDDKPYEVPAAYPSGQHFLGGNALAKPKVEFWDAPGITCPAPARFVFSRNTCSGCHVKETGTESTHIKPNIDPGDPGQLSAFLIGGAGATVADPVVATTQHTFADLDRRKGELAAAAMLDCVCQLFHAAIYAPH